MRIGWENTSGGYYIKKLLAETNKQAENMGDLSDLTTTEKTDIVSALENPTMEEGEE